MKKIQIAIIATAAAMMMGLMPIAEVHADEKATSATSGSSSTGKTCETTHVLGLRAWYDNLVDTSTCEIRSDAFTGEENLRTSVWTIVLNLVSCVLGVVGYLAICFVIWGGYQYMLANGDPGKVAKGKKTITNSLIGLAICMLASTISGMVSDIVAEGDGVSDNIFTTAMNHAFLWAGIIAVIVIVFGGIQYITSNGNPSGVQKAKQTIMYAAIGLAITLMAVAIVNFVVGAL